MKAIIFTSNTGYTRKYAQMLSQKTGFPAYELSQSKALLSELDEVVYMGWLMAGSVKGYKEAAKHYQIIAVCAVGLASNLEGMGKQSREKFESIGMPLFYLQGGFDMQKLHGTDKWIMKIMRNALRKKIAGKPDQPEDEVSMLNALENGADCVKEENLTPIIEFIMKK